MRMTHLSGVDLNLLVALEALLATRSVTAAAARTGVTQSAMSRTLGRLREVFGDPLLVRVGRGLVPTERAEGLVAPLADWLAGAEALLREGAPFDPATARRELTILAPDLATSLVMPRLVARLANEAPGIDLVTGELPRGDEAPALAERPSVSVTPGAPARGELRQRAGCTLGFAVIARRGHPALVDGGALTVEAFAGLRHLLIAPSGRPGGVVDRALGERGLTRRVAARVKTFAIAGEIIAGSDLVATVPAILARRFAASLPIVVLPPPLALARFTLYVAWHERYHHDAGHAWLRRAVVEALNEVDEGAEAR